MPRVAVPIRDLTTLGTNLETGMVAADSTNNHYVDAGVGHGVLLCGKTGATPGLITVLFGVHPVTGSATVNRTYTPTTANCYFALGPFPASWYDQLGSGYPGQLWFNVAAGTTMSFHAFRVPLREG